MIPLTAVLADHKGSRPLLLSAVRAGLLTIIPCYLLMTGPELWKVIIGQFGFSILLAFIYGSGAILSAKLLPQSVRMTGLALGYNTAHGSLSPMIATWLVNVTAESCSSAFYLVAIYLGAYSRSGSLAAYSSPAPCLPALMRYQKIDFYCDSLGLLL